jgi:hypothetical protein
MAPFGKVKFWLTRQNYNAMRTFPNLFSLPFWKMAVFWVAAPSSLVEVYQRFRGPCCLHHQAGDVSYTAMQ